MADNIYDLTESFLSDNVPPGDIKRRLVKKGFMESDIDRAIERVSAKMRLDSQTSASKKVKLFAWKEIFDRVGYGFVSHPFLNILFWFSGASYFLIGLINGLRNVLSLVFSSFLKEFTNVHYLKKNFISRAGIFYGFSFLILSFAVVLRAPWLYAIAFLAGSLGVVVHGELYVKFLKSNLKREKMGGFLSKISIYGVLITIVSLLLSGYIMDLFPLSGKTLSLTIFGQAMSLHVYGYLVSFEITALVFILSGYVLSHIKQETSSDASMISFVGEFLEKVKVHSKVFLQNKAVLLLVLASLFTGAVQVLGNSFYGIFIYDSFKNIFLGGFLNVAVIFSIAVIFSFIGPWFTKSLYRNIGITPMLVFGTLLTAMLPLSLAYNPNIYVVGIATALSIIGSSILGVAQGFFTRRLLSVSERKIYFSLMGVIISIPMLLLVLAGSYIASVDLVLLFKTLILALVVLVAPLYLAVLFMYERTSQKSY